MKQIIYTVFKGTDREFMGNKIEICKHFKINYPTFNSRLNLSYTMEETIDWGGGKCDRRSKTVFKGTDREFTGNKKEIAEHFNINYQAFITRLQHYTMEEAIDCGGRHYKKLITVFKGTDREFTGTQKEIAKHFNITFKLFNYRLNLNYTPEEAITIPLQKINQNNLSYMGQKGNMRDLCKFFNKNYIEVYNKVKNMHTFEWAMNTTENPYVEE